MNAPPDPTYQLNRLACQADLSYSMALDLIKICDLNLGNKSVTNDIENVLRKIEAWHQASIAGFRIMYRDSDGHWDGVWWDGQDATFFAFRETSEAAAEKKVRGTASK
jgi:hypothetical protein